MKVRLLRSAVIFNNGNPCKYGKGAIVDVSEDVLRDCWQIMRPVGYREQAKIDPAQPIIAQTVARKATIKATEVRKRK